MENSLLVIFGQNPCTIVEGLWPNFKATIKIHKNTILIGISSNFLHNISTCICIRKNYKNGEFSPSHFWPKSLYYSTGSLARFLSNF